MNYKAIDGALLREMVISGAAVLDKNKQALNDLNVFPVPDGDTGTNMSLTMQSVLKEVSLVQSDDLPSVARAMARGALKGARGNSGVILSQILRGLSKKFEALEEAGVADFAEALRLGQETAYKAVMKPKEGTVLTVIRVIAEKTKYETKRELGDFIDLVISIGEDTLKKTPDMLPQLKKAGVVDAGGQGLVMLLHAFASAIHGEAVPDTLEPFAFTSNNGEFSRATADEVAEMDEIVFAYCTEFFIQQLKPGVTEATVDKLRTQLSKIGDSLIVVGDPELVKVHVHTNNPGKALQYAIELGELYKVKIENMVQQHRELMAERAANEKAVGVVAVASGEGLSGVFKDLGVDEIVTGGQTMNPSTQDIADAVKRVPAKEVIVLPNNSNIILAAEQAQDFSKKKIYVLPTKTVPQGISAMLAFNSEAGGNDNFEAMSEGFSGVLTGSVTYAVRDTEYDGRQIHEGNYLGLAEGSIACCGDDLQAIALELSEKLLAQKSELLTIYFGCDATEGDAEILAGLISEKHPDTEVEVVNGGQPVYYYLISAE